ncbi:LPD7 domain-containing protein (plasmid) [Ampullimonas aquatilis]|uniref:LPD7 domain-containing protein n=1 Tax=Ampullimonas aquatilis TaxID=1341549 RepID=UPI003C788B4E
MTTENSSNNGNTIKPESNTPNQASTETNSDTRLSELEAKLRAAQIPEKGWQDRDDISGVMRELELLAAKNWTKAAELWDKVGSKDIDKPAFIDGDDISQKVQETQVNQIRAEQISEPPIQDEKSDKKNFDEVDLKTPAHILKRFLQAEDKYYFRGRENNLAFEDKGSKLASNNNDPDVIKAMVDLAEAKGWTTIKVNGSEEFKREAWLQAQLSGIEVKGFRPKKVDIAKLNDLLQEKDLTQQKSEQSIKTNKPREKQPIDEHYSTLTTRQKEVIDTLQTILRDRGDSNEAVREAAEIAAQKMQNNRVYVGKLVEHGIAPYDDKPENGDSYFIKIATDSGEKKIWGVDLERSLFKNQVKPGEDVVLSYQGRRVVPLVSKDEHGVTQKSVTRNTWDITKVDELQKEVVERAKTQAKNAEKSPLIKVYDHEARKANDIVRDVERTRNKGLERA